jgi:hypothetical protein
MQPLPDNTRARSRGLFGRAQMEQSDGGRGAREAESGLARVVSGEE